MRSNDDSVYSDDDSLDSDNYSNSDDESSDLTTPQPRIATRRQPMPPRLHALHGRLDNMEHTLKKIAKKDESRMLELEKAIKKMGKVSGSSSSRSRGHRSHERASPRRSSRGRKPRNSHGSSSSQYVGPMRHRVVSRRSNQAGQMAFHEGKDGKIIHTRGTTKLEDYFDRLLFPTGIDEKKFEKKIRTDTNYLGAYNMGVWGVSLKGKEVQDGLLASGKLPRGYPQITDNLSVSNCVKFHDTPHLWDWKDEEGKGEEKWKDQATTEAVQNALEAEGAWEKLCDAWKNVIGKSTQLVDVTSLLPPAPGSTAETKILAGLSECLDRWINHDGEEARPKLMIRFMFGMTADSKTNWLVMGSNNWWSFYNSLTNTLTDKIRGINGILDEAPPVVLYGSDLGSYQTPSSFNHSKIVAGDGYYACVGGHNMGEEVSSNKAPVIHDITSEVQGPAARSAHAFAASLWAKAAEDGRLDMHSFNWVDGNFNNIKAGQKWEPVETKPTTIQHKCSVIAGNCTGKSFRNPRGDWAKNDTHWCTRCGNWYCPYHSRPQSNEVSMDFVGIGSGGWHNCSVAAGPLGTQSRVVPLIQGQSWFYPMDTLPYVPDPIPKKPDGFVVAEAVMGVGRWGDVNVFGVDCTDGLKFGMREFEHIGPNKAPQYASDAVKRLMMYDEDYNVIRMSQQDLVNNGPFGAFAKSDHVICEILADRLKNQEENNFVAQVVVSSRFTQNCEGLCYSYGDGPREAIERIKCVFDQQGSLEPGSKLDMFPYRPGQQILRGTVVDLNHKSKKGEPTARNYKTESFVTVAPTAFNKANGTNRDQQSYVWPDKRMAMTNQVRMYTNGRFWNTSDLQHRRFGPGNHAKVLYVTNVKAEEGTGLVMIGSDNMYPSPLAEFNFVFEGADVVDKFRTEYWDKLWGHSERFGFTVNADGSLS